MKTKRIIAALAAAVMLASNQSVAAGVSYAAEAIEESQIVYGEVNGDGKVGISDAVAILQYIANRDKYPLNAQALRNADCVDHGDGVTGMDAFALKLVDAKMLSLEEFPVTSQRIQECLNPPAEEDALFEEVYTFGVYNTETKAIDIKWLVNETVKEVEIFVSDDNKKYKSVAKVKDTDEYSYEVKEEFDTIFFKVAYNDKDGKLHESFPFFIVLKDGKYVTDFIDSDEDGVADMVESVYGSKIDSADSDEDGLSDYEEIYITQTDPTVRDSFKKGISDADADCDEDGISNLSEIKNGIDPLREDTDDDRLSDLVEINELKTDPLIRDTDEDGLTDYAEHKMGLDPLNPKTGDVPDAEAVIQQEIDTDSFVLEAVNADADNKAYKLSVDIKTAGFAEEVVSASKSRYTAVIDEEAVIGDIVDIAVADGTEPESMSISFTVDDEYRNNTIGTYKGLEGIKRLTVFQYNEDIHMLIPMDTEYSESDGVVSAEIDGTGTYCILDSEQWFDSLGIKPEQAVTESAESADTESIVMSSVADAVIGDEVSLKRNEPFDLYFTLQRSGKNGEENFLYQKEMIHDIASYLFKYYDDAVIHVIPYDVENKLPKLKADSDTCDFTNIIELDEALDKIEYSTELGPANRFVSYRLAEKEIQNTKPFTTENMMSDYRWIVINLMNSETMYDTLTYGNWCDAVFVREDIKKRGAFFGEVYYQTPPDSRLSFEIGSWGIRNPGNNGGIYHVDGLDTGFDTETNYDEVLDFIVRCVRTYNNYKAPSDAGNINVMLRDKLSPDSGMDTDRDGISDWDELDKNYVNVNPDGTFSFMTYNDVFERANISVGKNDEMVPINWQDTPYGPQLEDYYNNSKLAIWISNPQLKDTDFDRILDVDDNAPFDHIDTHFQVVNDYSKVTYRQLLSNEYEDVYEKAKEEAPKDRINPGLVDTSAQCTFAVLLLMDALASTDGISRAVGFDQGGITLSLDKKNISRYLDARGSVPNAVKALTHYLCANGEDFEFEKYPYAIAMTNRGRNKYYDNMNAYFDMVEKNTMIGNTYNFSTVKDINKPEDKEDKWGRPEWKCDFHGESAYNINAFADWWLSFGGCQTALSSTVYCHRNDNGEIVYTSKIRYYALDVYDFENDTLEKALHRLNNTGWGRTFISYGCYETEIEWVKGSRYPKLPHENEENCKTVEFEGINDPNFEKNKEAAELFYLLV